MYTTANVHELIQRIYLASADSSRWSHFLELLREQTDAANAVFSFGDRENGGASVQAVSGITPETLQLYHTRYSAIDPFTRGAAALGPLRPGFIGLAQDLISETDLMQTDFYKEFGKQAGFLGGLVCVIHAEGPLFSVAGLNRKPGKFFGDSEVRLFQELLPHLRTAMQIHRELLREIQVGRAALATIDRLPYVTFVCDAGGEVLHANQTAQRDDPQTIGQKLRLPSAADTQKLRRAIAAAADAVVRGTGGDITVPLEEGLGQPCTAVVSPVHQQEVVRMIRPMVAVIFNTAVRLGDASAEALQALYQLTPSEARLACEWIAAPSLDRAAESAGLSYETGRTYLKRIFSKTGTSSQPELLRKLLASLPAL